MKKRILYLLLALLLFLVVFIFYKTNWLYNSNNIFDKKEKVIINTQNNEATSSDEIVAQYTNFLADGLKYKASGDSGNSADYQKAIDSFQKAIDLTEGKFWVPVVNIANTEKIIGKYKEADEHYNQALLISNYSESNIYLAKIDLYRYYLKKSNEEIDKLYNEAIDRVVLDQSSLIVSYVSFLMDIGKNDEALKYYKILSQRYPDNQAYKDMISSLEKIK